MASREDESGQYPRDAPAPAGFPDGWKCVLKQYGEDSKNRGMVYTRFHSIDGRHRNLTSTKKVFELHCRDHPHLNPEDLMATYQRCKADVQDRRVQERRQLAKRPREDREANVARFNERCGTLSGPVALAFAGWHATWRYMPGCDQCHVIFYDDSGGYFQNLKDIEAMFGWRFQQGPQEEERIVNMIAEASQRADPELFSKGARIAKERRSFYAIDGDGKELGCGLAEAASTCVRRWEGRLDAPSRAVGRPRRPSEEQLALADVPEGLAPAKRAPTRPREGAPSHCDSLPCLHPTGVKQEDFAASVVTVFEARGALKGFHALMKAHIGQAPKTPSLLAVYGAAKSRYYRERVHGVYRQLPEPLGGRPCYQKLLHAPAVNCILGCDRIYVFWSEATSRWQIATELVEGAFVLAYGDDNVATPLEVGCAWQMQNGSGDFTEEAGLALLRGAM